MCKFNRNELLRDGNVIKLDTYDDKLWAVFFGFYMIEYTVLFGWYLSEVNGNTTLSFTEKLQENAVLITFDPYSKVSINSHNSVFCTCCVQ